ncbi:hypothetical protein B0H10DRAFT_1951293 [Mycena sp. CBHHK59/15]|nr:hypothetical protein B0H10DRAFT_1951293 [Mycena sp. CBHHK59/15]
MSSITLRHCTVDRKTGKTIARALSDSNLGAHEIDSTFFRASPDPKGNIFYQKSDGTPLVTTFVAKIGSEAQGTWMAAYPKKSLPLVTYDLHGKDETLEATNGEHYDVTECIICGEHGPDDDTVLLQCHKDSTTSPRTPRKRISKVNRASKSPELPVEMTDMDIVPPEPTAGLHGQGWEVDCPEELYTTLTEGTLVLVVVSLATYVIKDQMMDSGTPLSDKKPWNPPVPEIPEARVYSPMTRQCRARDDAADTTFNAFGSKSSLSLTKRARCTSAGSS